MAVTMNLIQTGSASVTLHIAAGDVITLKMLNANHDPQLAEANAHLQLLSALTGATFTFAKGGGAS